MNSSHEAPKLPKLPFIVGDLVLIAAAVLIAFRSASPLGPLPLLAITICVVFGAALLVVPFLANYARRQDAELTDRQNQIAALARTTAESAEQLGIAAAGLHGIGESSKQNLETIGRLPAQLQERINSLTQQLAGSAIAGQAAIKEDLAKLEAVSEKISGTVATLDATAKKKSDALVALEKDLADALTRATTQINALLSLADSTAARLAASATAASTSPVFTPTTEESKPKPSAPKPKAKATPASPPPEPVAEVVHIAEPAPVPVAPVPIAPVEPEPIAVALTVVPSALPSPVAPSPETFTPAEPDAADVPVDEAPEPKSPRARKTKADDDTGFDLGLVSDTPESTESSVTSDGFTRLIATAYIGIGNKLYIRGEGPGLSWEKGVPLQFVSIGKWRWETPDATTAITAKLFKNDQVECLGLGSLTLEPGRQHEVNAGF